MINVLENFFTRPFFWEKFNYPVVFVGIVVALVLPYLAFFWSALFYDLHHSLNVPSGDGFHLCGWFQIGRLSGL
jgi:hypothetical protein